MNASEWLKSTQSIVSLMATLVATIVFLVVTNQMAAQALEIAKEARSRSQSTILQVFEIQGEVKAVNAQLKHLTKTAERIEKKLDRVK